MREVGRVQNYWSNTAMTTFLTDALKKHPLDFSTIDIDQSALEAYEPENPRIVTLPYQTGYLTIRRFRQFGDLRRFDLCVQNREVENSFLTQLAPVYAGLDPDRSINNQFAAAEALVAGDAAKGDHSLDGCPPREHAPLILQAGGDCRDADAGA